MRLEGRQQCRPSSFEMNNIAAALQTFRRQLPASVTLIAVSKGQGIEAIQAALDAGQRHFGENRVQEALQKWPLLKARYPDSTLHLIGPLQTNKVKDALGLFDVIHTIDRPKLVEALAREKSGVKFLVQVNQGGEPQKSGIAPAGLPALLALCKKSNLPVSGLMTIPPQTGDAKIYFQKLAALAKRHNLPGLSMGMSGDWQEAVAAGATYIRVGGAIFGARLKP